MTATFFKIYAKQALCCDADDNTESRIQTMLPVAKKLTKKLVLNLYSIALVTDPFLWINFSTGCQEIVTYIRLLKKTTSYNKSENYNN